MEGLQPLSGYGRPEEASTHALGHFLMDKGSTCRLHPARQHQRGRHGRHDGLARTALAVVGRGAAAVLLANVEVSLIWLEVRHVTSRDKMDGHLERLPEGRHQAVHQCDD
jgi:hypothetical protein